MWLQKVWLYCRNLRQVLLVVFCRRISDLFFVYKPCSPQNVPEDEFRDTNRERENTSLGRYWHCLHYSNVWSLGIYILKGISVLLSLNTFNKLNETQVNFTMQIFKIIFTRIYHMVYTVEHSFLTTKTSVL